MKTLTKFQLYLYVITMSASLSAYSHPGENIVLNPVTGDYTVTYWNGASLEKIIFVPATKITPVVRSKFELEGAEKITYWYTVSSKLQSKQSLDSVRFDPVYQLIVGQRVPADFDSLTRQEESVALVTPNGWRGRLVSSPSGNGARVSWHPASGMEPNGIMPGGTLPGFGFSSYALPGLGVVQLEGVHPVLAFPDEGFGSNSAIADEFYRLPDFVPLNAAVPAIAVPDPFDAAALLGSIQTHTHIWIGMNLLDATFSSQLDRYFQSAISAYRLNQPKVGRQHLRTMRALIKKEHADADREDGEDERGGKDNDRARIKSLMIGKLAARVLDFDLKYVMKRMGGDNDD